MVKWVLEGLPVLISHLKFNIPLSCSVYNKHYMCAYKYNNEHITVCSKSNVTIVKKAYLLVKNRN